VASQLLAGGRRHYLPAEAFEQRDEKQPLELADLHGKRLLADLAGFGGAALTFGRGQQAAEVPKVRLVGIAAVLANAYLAKRKVKPP
jgi:hypothetical protein